MQWWFIGKWLLGDMGRFNGERNSGIAEKFRSPWRCGSQDQGHAATILTGDGD
jgi:hypothetical protein